MHQKFTLLFLCLKMCLLRQNSDSNNCDVFLKSACSSWSEICLLPIKKATAKGDRIVKKMYDKDNLFSELSKLIKNKFLQQRGIVL